MPKILANTTLPSPETLTLGALTAGSVVFASTAGVIAQDATNFAWDDTNNNLELGGVLRAGGLSADDGYFSYGAEKVGADWIARATGAAIVQVSQLSGLIGRLAVLTNEFLTAGNTFTPAERFAVSTSGATITGSLWVKSSSGYSIRATAFTDDGVTDPLFELAIGTGDVVVGSLYADNDDADKVKLSVPANLNAFVITQTALVGVNQSAPGARLHITEVAGSEVFRLESTATNDDPSDRIFQNRVTTTGATVTTLHTITLADDTAYLIEANIVGRRTGGAAGTAGDTATFIRKATAKRTAAGGAVLEGAVEDIYTRTNQASWNATFDVSANTVRVRINGSLNNSVTWHLSKLSVMPLST